ncbi:phospholipase D-like domain-containing protein [Haloprofundus halobius]|uniref:phospholipase D-like domain-containing protein n=1 Tax=Haloprofundus halobius TaxID=2876194 RepID=UPI001CCFAFA1|nr:phospholipase D-like domain-containing protein [Haloprofundus halobius]
MVRAFSLPSSGLRYLLGYSLVHADRVAICSPWLSDVELRLPLGTDLQNRRMLLSEALRRFETELNVYVRQGESHNEFILSRMGQSATVTEVDDLHAKAIVTDGYVYIGSANITRGGLLTNRELCEIVENQYEDVATYLKSELGLGSVVK